MHSMNWDNLRYVLAVADLGSVSAAGRELRVNHATVLRRVAAFERDHGGPVFERTVAGYRVLPDRARVIEAAREVEAAVDSVGRLMHGGNAPLRGRVRVSSTDSLCQIVLPPLVQELQDSASELTIELMSNNYHADFARMQADISVRPALSLPDELVGSPCARLTFAVYATPGAPEQWLSLYGSLAQSAPAMWMSQTPGLRRATGGGDSFLVLCELARMGLGLAALPTFIGDKAPELVRRKTAMPQMEVPIWVATYKELADMPRIRAVRDRISSFLAERDTRLAH